MIIHKNKGGEINTEGENREKEWSKESDKDIVEERNRYGRSNLIKGKGMTQMRMGRR